MVRMTICRKPAYSELTGYRMQGMLAIDNAFPLTRWALGAGHMRMGQYVPISREDLISLHILALSVYMHMEYWGLYMYDGRGVDEVECRNMLKRVYEGVEEILESDWLKAGAHELYILWEEM